VSQDPNIPPDVTPPDLAYTWDGGCPSMDGDPGSEQQVGSQAAPAAKAGQTGGKPADKPPEQWIAPPIVAAYTVSPGSIRNGTAPALGQSQRLVDTYENLKNYINDTKSWIFSVGNANTIGNLYWQPGEGGGVTASPINDPHPDLTDSWTAVSDNLLLQVADAVELGGQYIDAVHTAGEIYTSADMHSEPPSMTSLPEFNGNIHLPPSGF
jgi:hypothetical protein